MVRYIGGSIHLSKRAVRIFTLLLLAMLAAGGMLSCAYADRATRMDAAGFVYDASGYFSQENTIVGYVGKAGTVVFPAETGHVAMQDTYDYSGIKVISLKNLSASVEVGFYGTYPSLKYFVGPDDSGSPYYVVDGALVARPYRTSDGYYIKNTVLEKVPGAAAGEYQIPDEVDYIGWEALLGCAGIMKVTMTDKVTYISSYAFQDCTKLREIKLSNQLEGISERAFANCSGLTALTLPDSLESIDSEAFLNCTGLKALRIPASVTSIGTNAFKGTNCVFDVAKGSAAMKYMIQNQLQYTVDGKEPAADAAGEVNGFSYFIKDDDNATITGCTLTGDIVIPGEIAGHTVDNLERKLFYGKVGITSVSIPATVTYFGDDKKDNDWDYVFSYCYDLKEIQVDAANPVFCSKEGVLYSKDMKTLFAYPAAKAGETYQVPDTVTTLCCTSFASSKYLRSLYLRNKHAWFTFYNTGNLTVYYLPGGRTEQKVAMCIEGGSYHDVSSIWNSFATYDMIDLSTLQLPEGLKTIQKEALSGVPARKIIVSNSVTRIESKAFANCKNLEVLDLPDKLSRIADDILDGCGEVTIVCSRGSTAETWAKKKGFTILYR